MARRKSKDSGGQQAQKASPASLGAKISQLKEFFEESKVEIKKVVWPSRKETVATSIAVVVFTVVVALFLGVVDFGLSQLISVILS
ncbi:preprotein translocase subunit SecE [Paucidesulfovibrio gracilis DSM 16080]|uniref:Protein translocase subunit SecE n=1 Tax=Paucidesulfovibrio gracilis DSM 16080 TaxID=1121449 RepID=A0A1T4WBD1_9BACT|nr:preprotein translocase subunit SecE [Paucidesulfovibrio gracilis]SKA74624.1 preprotein translocase subunit SecE [Paucidesulfovibrio gracilis DSM 16080]